MSLSKLEIQQMLREMNIKFHSDETYESLKQRLQVEHHNLWLRSVSRQKETKGKRDTVVVRKRKEEDPAKDAAGSLAPVPSLADTTRKSVGQGGVERSSRSHGSYRYRPIEKPLPGKPWKSVADGVEPFNRKKRVFHSVLRRARMCCEQCGNPSVKESGEVDLAPFHLRPLADGGEHSIKNVVALCPSCMSEMKNDPDPKTVKMLNRKTRAKLYDSLTVLKKKTVRGRRRAQHKRR